MGTVVPWGNEPLDREIQFCQCIQYLFSEEPYHFQFYITSSSIKFFVYYNNQTCDVFDDLLYEMNLNMEDFDLINRGWGEFYVRKVSPPSFTQEYSNCRECISINQNLIDLVNNIIL